MSKGLIDPYGRTEMWRSEELRERLDCIEEGEIWKYGNDFQISVSRNLETIRSSISYGEKEIKKKSFETQWVIGDGGYSTRVYLEEQHNEETLIIKAKTTSLKGLPIFFFFT